MHVFIAVFIVYLYTLFPASAPYRDTGEMVSAAHTLGIAHPPGYPLYTLASKAWLVVDRLGNEGYRMNVLSALGGAAAAWMLYVLLAALGIRRSAAALLSLVFALSYLQWYLSLVSEMYTLNTLAVLVFVYLLWKIYKGFGAAVKGDEGPGGSPVTTLYFAAFIFGACLGIRMDLLLAAPAALIVLYSIRKRLKAADYLKVIVFFAAGVSVFAYLPFRSNAGPLLDWNHPATLERFLGTVARKTHGGTLDLISAPYASGYNFPATMKFYFNHLFTGFAYAGPFFGLIGLYSLWKRERFFAAALAAAWLVSGPVFIYLANMPPNPHALAILEAHFLMPNVFAAVFMAEGVSFFAGGAGVVAPLACSAMIAFQLFSGARDLQKRWNLVAYDYAKNILRSMPEDSILVMKKDVQIFALWNRQYVEGDRKYLPIAGQGLIGSPWYQAPFMKLHPDVALCPLRDAADWKTLAEMNPAKSLYFSFDADYARPEGYTELPRGLVNRTAPAGTARSIGADSLLDEIYPYRGDYVYDAYREFFTPDIIDDYSKARAAAAGYYMEKRDFEKTRRELMSAVAFHRFFPHVYNLMGYTFVAENRYAEGAKYYGIAAQQFEEMIEMAANYNALDDVTNNIRKEAADACISLGVCNEKIGKDNEALACYSRALGIWPGQTKAYFNRSVIFWNRGDWKNVISELEQALRIDPNYREAAYYLEMAKRKMGH